MQVLLRLVVISNSMQLDRLLHHDEMSVCIQFVETGLSLGR